MWRGGGTYDQSLGEVKDCCEEGEQNGGDDVEDRPVDAARAGIDAKVKGQYRRFTTSGPSDYLHPPICTPISSLIAHDTPSATRLGRILISRRASSSLLSARPLRARLVRPWTLRCPLPRPARPMHLVQTLGDGTDLCIFPPMTKKVPSPNPRRPMATNGASARIT